MYQYGIAYAPDALVSCVLLHTGTEIGLSQCCHAALCRRILLSTDSVVVFSFFIPDGENRGRPIAEAEPVPESRGTKFQFDDPALLFYGTTALLVVGLFTAMSGWISENALLWIWKYVSSHSAVPLKFIVYFVAVLVLGLGLGLPFLRKCITVKIVLRKYFHFLAMVMFVPTILVHIRFLSLAFAIAFALFLVLESFRSAGIPPVATIIGDLILPYIDKRDSGTFVLTHMYLLLGCAVPVWYAFFVHGGIYAVTK